MSEPTMTLEQAVERLADYIASGRSWIDAQGTTPHLFIVDLHGSIELRHEKVELPGSVDLVAGVSPRILMVNADPPRARAMAIEMLTRTDKRSAFGTKALVWEGCEATA